VLFDLFRDGIRRHSEPTDAHTHREVLPFGKRRAIKLLIRIAFDPFLAGTCAFCWRVAALGAFRRGTVNLHKLGVIHIAAEGAFDGPQDKPCGLLT
jgi:hypothetical protein